MMFSYEAANASGANVEGTLEASTRKEAIRLLHHQGLAVTSIEELIEASTVLRRRSSKQDLLLSFHEMATLLESGVSIGETLEAQARANYPYDLLLKYKKMTRSIQSGDGFAQALRSGEFELPEYFFQLAQSGELTGNLAGGIRSAVDQFEYDLKTAADLRGALIYPSILIASGIVAVLLVFFFVVPKFAPLVERSDNLPLLSTIVLSAGMWFNENIGLVLLLCFGLVGGIIAALRNPSIRLLCLSASFNLPIVGTWLKESDTANWSSMMATLLNSKVGLLEALELSRSAVRSNQRSKRLEQVTLDIRAGLNLAEALEKSQALTATGYNLVRSGELTGKLPPMMRSVAKLYEEAAKARMKTTLALIEPVAILLIGSVIGTIILGVILAITSVNELAT
jgi:general secretion pathway protein F